LGPRSYCWVKKGYGGGRVLYSEKGAPEGKKKEKGSRVKSGALFLGKRGECLSVVKGDVGVIEHRPGVGGSGGEIKEETRKKREGEKRRKDQIPTVQ